MFSLPRAALAIHTSVEGHRKKNKVVVSKRNCISEFVTCVGMRTHVYVTLMSFNVRM
jgi:hypothetical protein